MDPEDLPELEALDPICPHCAGQPLERCQYRGVEVDVCPDCGGLWCLSRQGNPQDKEMAQLPLPQPSDLLTENLPLLCPRCGCALAAFRIKAVRALEVDRCDDCGGVWFDRREWDFLAAARRWQAHRKENSRKTSWSEWWFQFLLSLPIEFNVRPRSRPWATLGIIGLCVVVFGILALLGEPSWLERLAFELDRLPSIWGFAGLLTSQFVHGGLVHLIGNMYFLYILGDNVEDVLGPIRFLAFFLLCGIAGDLAFGLIAGSKPLIGASGGVAGVMAAYLVLFRWSRLTVMLIIKQIKVPALLWISIWILLQFWGMMRDPFSEATGIAWAAHLTSFLLGLILIGVFRRPLVDRHPLLHLLETRRLLPRAESQ